MSSEYVDMRTLAGLHGTDAAAVMTGMGVTPQQIANQAKKRAAKAAAKKAAAAAAKASPPAAPAAAAAPTATQVAQTVAAQVAASVPPAPAPTPGAAAAVQGPSAWERVYGRTTQERVRKMQEATGAIMAQRKAMGLPTTTPYGDAVKEYLRQKLLAEQVKDANAIKRQQTQAANAAKRAAAIAARKAAAAAKQTATPATASPTTTAATPAIAAPSSGETGSMPSWDGAIDDGGGGGDGMQYDDSAGESSDGTPDWTTGDAGIDQGNGDDGAFDYGGADALATDGGSDAGYDGGGSFDSASSDQGDEFDGGDALGTSEDDGSEGLGRPFWKKKEFGSILGTLGPIVGSVVPGVGTVVGGIVGKLAAGMVAGDQGKTGPQQLATQAAAQSPATSTYDQKPAAKAKPIPPYIIMAGLLGITIFTRGGRR